MSAVAIWRSSRRASGRLFYPLTRSPFIVTNPLELTFLTGESVSCHGKLYDLRERLARSTILGLESEPMKNGGVVRGQGGDR
jgi:hypothetical protein